MSFQPKKNTCKIQGQTINRNSDTLLLVKATEDLRFQSIKIPIVDNHFEFEWEVVSAEMYHLIFQEELFAGGWRQYEFMAEEGVLNFKLYDSEKHQLNETEGGTLNEELKRFKKLEHQKFAPRYVPLEEASSKLWKEDLYFSDDMKQLKKQWRQAQSTNDKSGMDANLLLQKELRLLAKDLSLSANTINDSIKLIDEERIAWQYDYIKNHPTEVGFFFVIQDLGQYEKSADLIAKATAAYKVLAKKFPNHPYTPMGKVAIDGISSAQLGLPYIDFEAFNLQGELQKLSSLMKGELIILNFGATWCAPCIQKSKRLVPIVEKYKDKGVSVIGVAREFKDFNRLEALLQREQYPWPTLIDLDDQHSIWSKYNISRTAGALFIVNSNGMITSIDASIEEILKQVQAL